MSKVNNSRPKRWQAACDKAQAEMTYETDNRREFYTVNGDYLRISPEGRLERFRLGNWEAVKASDYPNALLAKLSELVNEMLAEEYPDN